MSRLTAQVVGRLQRWERKDLVDMKTVGGSILHAEIALCLEPLKYEFSQSVLEHTLETDRTISDQFNRRFLFCSWWYMK